MADVITRLKIESGEFDAKIKRATQGLLQMEQDCRKVGGTLAVLEKEQKQYVQSLGNMQTVSNTVRGKISELSNAYIELRSQYNRLTEEEKKGDFGRALSASLDQLKTRVAQAKDELKDIQKELDGSGSAGGGFLSGLNSKMEGALAVFGGNLMTKAAGAVANLGQEVYGMVQQGIELARQGEGIRIAFERLGRGDILDGLREATHGTVTDIELMKAAVKFNDFKLPLDELGTMLAFAQQKAKDTGQSVDYMVDSIVTGLGRKSLMILDNLGLSASEIKERMAETGDMTKAVGAIIREQMAKAGDYVETAADRATKADVDLKNAMDDLGRTLMPLQEAGVSLFTSWETSALKFIKNALEPLIARFTEAGRLQASYNRQGGSEKVDRMVNTLQNTSADKRQGLYNTQVNKFNSFIKERQDYINLLNSYRAGSRGEGNGYTPENKARIDELFKQFGTDDTSRLQSQIDGATKQLQEYQKAAKNILKPVEANIDTKQAEQNVKTLTAQLKELEKQRKDAVKKGDQEQVETLTKQISQTKTNLGYLDPSAVKNTTTGGKTKQQQAEDKVEAALLDYNQAIEKARLEMESGMKTEADAKKANLSAQEQLWTAYGKAYNIYADPKYKEAQDAAAAEIVRLGGEVKSTAQVQEATKKALLEAEAAYKKEAEAANKMADYVMSASKATEKNSLKDFYSANNGLSAMGVETMEVPVEFTYTPNNLEAFTSQLKQDLANADVGSLDAQKLLAQLNDATALGEIMTYAMQNGMDMADLGEVGQSMWKRIFSEGADIAPEEFKKLLQIVADGTGKSLSMSGSGKVTEDKKEELKEIVSGMNNVTSGLSNMTNGLQQLGIQIPKEVADVLNVLNAVSSVIAGVQQIISVFQVSAITTNTAALAANTVALGANTASNGAQAGAAGGGIAGGIIGITASFLVSKLFSDEGLIHLANGGIVPHAANGFVVPGTHFSGDTTPILANAGEVVLNHAQVNNLANALEGGLNGGLSVETHVAGEDLVLVINNTLSHAGFGRMVTTNNF